jgi:hypothetical protein
MIHLILLVIVLVTAFFLVKHIVTSAKAEFPKTTDDEHTILKKAQSRKASIKALTLTFLIIIGSGYLLKYFVLRECKEDPLGAWCPGIQTNLSGFYINPDGSLTEIEKDAEAPFIESIMPRSASKGSLIEIKGLNLSGFEGDLAVTFEGESGDRFTLFDEKSYPLSGASIIRVALKEPCQKGEIIYGRYSGIESLCDFKEMKPGTYKVYVEPWSKKSNEVSFTLLP